MDPERSQFAYLELTGLHMRTCSIHYILLSAAVQLKSVTAIMGHYCDSKHYARFSWGEMKLISNIQQSWATAIVTKFD